jgi:hypothetical protein
MGFVDVVGYPASDLPLHIFNFTPDTGRCRGLHSAVTNGSLEMNATWSEATGELTEYSSVLSESDERQGEGVEGVDGWICGQVIT